MLQNDGACQAESDSCTGNLLVYIFLRTIERFENLFRLLLAEPFSGIDYFDEQISAFYQYGAVLSREMGEQFTFSLCDRTDTDGYFSFRRSEFEGIGEQVEEYLFDFRFVETNLVRLRQFILQRETDLPIVCHALERVVHFADKGREIETGLLQDCFTGLVFLYVH